MDIEHNSREKFYRFPFGAVTCGGEVRLRLAVSGAGIPSAVRLVYMEDGKGEVRKDMPYIFDVGDHCIYSGCGDWLSVWNNAVRVCRTDLWVWQYV